MSVRNATFNARARAEVKTITPANVNIGNTFSYTINGKTVTVTATAATVANVTALAAAALEAATEPEFTEITWVDSTTHVTATSAAGVPFTLTSSAAGGTATNTTATTTAATGPTFWDDANNWDGAVPITGDTANVNLDLGSFTDGLGQSAVTLAVLNVTSTSETPNTLRRPKLNPAGYTEYRDTLLEIGATVCKIDAGATVGINFGSVETACEVRRTGSSSGSIPAVELVGTNTSNTFEVVSGSVGLAFYDGETCNSASLITGPDANVVAGDGATIIAIENLGTVDFKGTFTVFTNSSGNATLRGDATPDDIYVAGASRVDYRLTGTVGAVEVHGTIDKSNDQSPATWNSTILHPGGSIIDPAESITHTNGIDPGPGVRQVSAA